MIRYQETKNVDYQSAINEKKEITVLDFDDYQIVFGKKQNSELLYLKPISLKNNLLFKESFNSYTFSKVDEIEKNEVYKLNVFHKALFFCIIRLKKHLKEKSNDLTNQEKNLLLFLEFLIDSIYISESFLIIEFDKNNILILKNKKNNIQHIYYLDFNKKNKDFIIYENVVEKQLLNKDNVFNYLTKEDSGFELELLLQFI